MRKALLLALAVSITMLAGCASQQANEKIETKNPNRQYVDTDTGRWLIHDINRPAPPVITPDEPGQPFKDVIVLFDGKNLDNWTDKKGNTSKWIVKDGAMQPVKRSGYIITKQEFGSCQLHIEYKTPTPVKGKGQGRGNSGIFLMNEYEIQILDSFENSTYPDGQCGALYGREVPDVDVNLRPGEWQSFDILFHRPIFKDGKVERKARFTVLHNGIWIHDDVELQGGTQWDGPHKISDYNTELADKRPIALQDHGNPVKFRNIWIREIKD